MDMRYVSSKVINDFTWDTGVFMANVVNVFLKASLSSTVMPLFRGGFSEFMMQKKVVKEVRAGVLILGCLEK